MSQNTYCNPIVYINGKIIDYLDSYSFTTSMNNTLQTLNVKFTNPHLENMDLFGGKIELYHNYGSSDGVPLFRGYITQTTDKETSMSINAQDPRLYLSGQDGVTVDLTDKKNYDGMTLTQFLYSFISTEVNTESTVIGLSSLTEIDKPVYMTGVREKQQSPWNLITSTLSKAINDNNISEPLDYFIDINHTSNSSDIFFRKKSLLSDKPSYIFSYYDGIVKLTYKERPPYNIGVARTNDGETQKFIYGNTPTGKKAITISGEFESPADARKAAINKVLLDYNDTKEIDMVVSKCHNISLGTVIYINVPDNNVRGKYRVTGKTITFDKNNLTCKLKCNQKPIKVSDFISS
tara:strand:+ start:310 stop:1356 length:1047 start_codon:yes stop_codon:yes gene_type:complete